MRRSLFALTGLIVGVLGVLVPQAWAQSEAQALPQPLDVAVALAADGLGQDGLRGLQANVQRCYEELDGFGAERGLKVAETCILLDRAANALASAAGAPKEAALLSGEAFKARRMASARLFFGGSVAAEDAYFAPQVRQLIGRLQRPSVLQTQ